MCLVWALVAIGRGAQAQGVPPPLPASPTEVTIEASTVTDWPTSGNVFELLETTQPSIVSDRFLAGGLYAGRAARVGGFSGSWTQTRFGIGDVDLTDPAGSGTPLVFPDLALWQRVRIATGLMPVDANAAGLAIDLDPLAPTTSWVRTAAGSISHFARTPDASAAPPALATLHDWDRIEASATGPLSAGRVGGAFAASWTRGAQFERGALSLSNADSGSVLARIVFTPSGRDTIDTLGWLGRSAYPFALRSSFAPSSETTDQSGHVQVEWSRSQEGRAAWRAYGAFTERARSSDPVPLTALFDQVTDGSPALTALAAPTTVRQWQTGVRFSPPRDATTRHAFEAGLSLAGAHERTSPGFSGSAGELVDNLPARIWRFSQPMVDSQRGNTSVAVFVSDRFDLSTKVSIEAGLRFDSTSGSADGAAEGIAWYTWLPRAKIQWAVTDFWHAVVFAGAGRTASILPLDVLAVGDPAAPTADVYRWDTPPGSAALSLSTTGPLVARVGPGAGSDGTFSRIDADLKRPHTDELVLGIEARPTAPLRLRLVGVARRESNVMALVNVGAPISSYSTQGVQDPGVDLVGASDDQVLTVYNRSPGTFGQDRYLLTNSSLEAGRSESIEASAALTTKRVTLSAGATANQSEGAAASRGYGPLSNDEGLLGDVLTNPNAATFARGRLFTDRAYTIRMTGTLRLPYSIRVGAIARYQDGQPFARMVVVPGLNQGVEAVRAFPDGASRFTFTGTLDGRVQKALKVDGATLDIIFDMFNVTNLANEVEERVVAGSTFRTVTAVQPPRSFHLGLRVTF